jgi:hypothetical protein
LRARTGYTKKSKDLGEDCEHDGEKAMVRNKVQTNHSFETRKVAKAMEMQIIGLGHC